MTDDDWRDDALAALVSMTPFVGPLLEGPARRLSVQMRAEHRRNGSRALDAAVAMSGLSRDDLAERIASDGRLVPLVTRVLYAAAMTGQDEILDALGAALGTAANDPDQTDEVELLLIGLTDLRRHHVRVLRSAAGPPIWLEPEREHDGVEPAKIAPVDDAQSWNIEGLASVSGLQTEVAYIAATGLANAGFLQAFSAFGGTGYQITSLGRNLIDVLTQYEDGQERSPDTGR